jgi:hypothetical protein
MSITFKLYSKVLISSLVTYCAKFFVYNIERSLLVGSRNAHLLAHSIPSFHFALRNPLDFDIQEAAHHLYSSI